MKQDVSTLIDVLYEYQEGELTENGKMHLKDELVELNEQLHKEEIEEGWRYDSMIIHVKQRGDLPQPFKILALKSPLTDEEYAVEVKEIVSLRWNQDGDLIVEVLAKKKKI